MKKLFLAILFLVTVDAIAQFDAQVSQYWANKSFFNPAATGSDNRASAYLLYRNQWVGMPGAPKTFFVGLDVPITMFGKQQGIGITAFKDEIGLFSNSSGSLDYSFKIKKWGGLLAVGAKIGFVSIGFNGTGSYWKDFSTGVYSGDDPAVPTGSAKSSTMDLGFGAMYSNNRFYSGISVTHALNPTLDLDAKSTFFVGKIVYLTAGYEFPIEESNISLLPSILYKTDVYVSQLDLTLRAEMNKMFWGGLDYRWNNAVSLLAGAKVADLSFGYAYEIPTSKLLSATIGSHEIFVKYSFDFAIQPKNKRKINKSIRYL